MTGRIVCGTCGYDYPEWRGVFYPQGLPREDFLVYYAERFPALEVDCTYYQMPTEQQMRSMLKRSGGSMLFSVKAPQTLTRVVPPSWQNEASLFRAALLPLMNAGVLSAVLFQFPQSFRYEPDNRRYLNRLLGEFSIYPSVVEFRHAEWLRDSVYTGLDERGAGICICDMPRLKALPGFVPVVTGSTGYIRYHGRNAENWYGAADAKASQRYEYQYSGAELRETVPAVQSIAARAKIVHVFFNNHPNGSAAVNAAAMQKLVE